MKNNRTAYIINGKLCKNLANYGSESTSTVTMMRNGDYFGITLQLLDKVYPLYNDYHINSFVDNINSNYSNNYILIEKFGLHQYYQEFGNDLFKLIVNHFYFLNELPIVYTEVKHITLNSNLITSINLDCHSLIPSRIIVKDCGSLLPSEWLGKEFKNGLDFHRSIDLLECRINKPPVTYLANYNMMLIDSNKLNLKFLNLEQNSLNIFLDKDTLKWTYNIPENFIDLSVKSEVIGNMKINYIYDENIIFNKSKNLEKISIGYNCSLLQKSIRRGNKLLLVKAMNNLHNAKPFNNPEINYKLVSGCRQLFWRSFISIIEDIGIYKTKYYLDIFDLVVFSKVFNNCSYTCSDILYHKLLKLMEKMSILDEYIDFRQFKEVKESEINLNNIYNRNYIGLYLAENEPGMNGDKIMIRKLKSANKIINLDNISKLQNINKNKHISNDLCLLASIDHHCYPPILVLLQEQLGDQDKTIKECGNILWNCSSKLNFRLKEYFEETHITKTILKVQYNLLKYFNLELYFDNILINDIYINKNNNDLKYIDFIINRHDKMLTSKILINSKGNNLKDNRLIDQIIYSNTLNTFTFLGKRILPIYTLNEIKFKISDKIISKNDAFDEYNKIYQYYLNNKTSKFPKELLKQYNLKLSNDNLWSSSINNIRVNYTCDYLIDLINSNNIELFDNMSINDNLLLINKSVNILQLFDYKILSKVHGKIMTSDIDKLGNNIIILARVDRNGNSTDSNCDEYEGSIKLLLDKLTIYYPFIRKINNFKYKIDKRCQSYKLYIKLFNMINVHNNNNKSNMIIKSSLWNHQELISNHILNLLIKYKHYGFGDASQVGSGKTLTALNVIYKISKLNGSILNYLILVPNTNLYEVWSTEINKHTDNVNIYIQNSEGKFILDKKTDGTVNIYISTMARNRDFNDNLNIPIDLVVIDECLTIQNKETKWTIKAFITVSKAKYGVLMLSATFFRTRFDKLLFMLKMLNTGLPERIEYLDTILNTCINVNIKVTGRNWTNNIIRLDLSDKMKLEYDNINIKYSNDSKLKYIKLSTLINQLNWSEILLNVAKHKVSLGKKVLLYLDSHDDIEYIYNKYNYDNTIHNYEYEKTEPIKSICVISKYKGTYGINNLINYDCIIMRPIESDKIPQVKGRLDRPGQTKTELELNFVILNCGIEELDITKIDIANNFYNNHILPLKI
jgi:superfamily II DNA or RNA helicase